MPAEDGRSGSANHSKRSADHSKRSTSRSRRGGVLEVMSSDVDIEDTEAKEEAKAEEEVKAAPRVTPESVDEEN